MLKKIFLSLMAVVLVVGLCPTVALAAGSDDTGDDLDANANFDDENVIESDANAINGLEDNNVAALDAVEPVDDETPAGTDEVSTDEEFGTIENAASYDGELVVTNESIETQEVTSLSATPLATDDIASGTLGTCTWVIDADGCLKIAPSDGVTGEFEMTDPDYSSWPWDSYRYRIKTVKIESYIFAAGSIEFMFCECYNLTSLDLTGFDTSNVTDMNSMFAHCSFLTSLDLTSFDTSNVTNMSSMFSNCYSLISLDLSSFDTSKVTDMSRMFLGSSFVSLDLSGLDTSNVTNMYYMFSGCSSLSSLDLSGLDTSNVTNMSDMFGGCSSLSSLDLSGLDTSNVTNMSDMFSNCTSLESLNLSGFDTSNVTNMYNMFLYCASLRTLDLSSFDTSHVTKIEYMFSNCSSLGSLNLSSFDTSNTTDMRYMFRSCSSLRFLDLTNFNTSNVTNMSSMFSGCTSLSSLDLLGLDTSNVINMSGMFGGCSSLILLNLSGLDTSNVINMSGMFGSCRSLVSIDLSGLDTSNVTDMSSMFGSCRSLVSIDLSGFDTSNVKNMSNMFSFCSSLTSLDLTSFDTSNVTNMSSMFSNCYSLISLDLSSFDTSNVTDMRDVFNNCPSLHTISVGAKFTLASSFPMPTKNGVQGKWMSADGIIYDSPSDIPNNVATTYTATFFTATMTIYAGNDRYDTSRHIAGVVADAGGRDAYMGVIVCSAQNGKFADALCASGLSGVLNYPVVLIDGSSSVLDDETAATVSSLFGDGKGDVIVLGGDSTINSSIETELSAYDRNGEVVRISGDDRYATAEAVYDYGATHGRWSTDYAIIAKGNDFPDALGAASFCTTNAAPMLLTNQNDASLPGYVLDAATQTSQAVIVGGTSSVSAEKGDVLKTYTSVKRIGGSTRYSTNYSFVTWELNHGMSIDSAGIATGTNFPDALGSSYLLSLTSSALLLTSKTESENATLYDLLADNAQSIFNISVFGGDASVAPDTRSAIQSATGGEWETIYK